MFFIAVDAHLKWLEVEVVSSEKTIEVFRYLLAHHGLPEQLISDNGPRLFQQNLNSLLRETVLNTF